ncbi:MAG: helix-turn-helix domain-containing protein [Cyclobacteriaceae bacterium]|nr:helix-turn-helix domain-containing protein [Cyclobacteriaceae bacterium]
MQKTLKEMTASWLKDGRLSKGLTQKELSERSHISIRSIQRIENGELVPRSHTLKTLAEILGLSFEEFMKSACEQEFTAPKNNSAFNKPQRLVLSIGICLVILLLAWAYLAQAAKFPETTFELLVFVSVTLSLITALLFFIWHKKA